MNLAIGRGQELHTDRKGRPEGARFQLSCRLDLTQQEQELVGKYAQAGFPLAALDIRDYSAKNVDDRILTVEKLVQGWSVESRFMTDLQRTEETLKEACTSFRLLLLALDAYGGQEMFEC